MPVKQAKGKPAAKPARPWVLYLLECKDGSLYAGVSPDPAARFELHCNGGGARYTRSHPPLRILAAKKLASHSAALIAEHALKKLTREKKLDWALRNKWKPRTPRRVG